jgi:hypothetical protein
MSELIQMRNRITELGARLVDANVKVVELEANQKVLVEALENLTTYRAYNGDDYVGDKARAALAKIKGE